jgi:FAD:protein FMN transferase
MTRHALSGATMGTRYSAIFHAPPSLRAEPIAAALLAAVDRVDRQMSSWKPDSDLNRLNAAPSDVWVPLPAEMMTVLAEGLRVGRASGGAFEMGVGPLVWSWGFGPGRETPGAGTAAASAASALELDALGQRARKHGPISLDLAGIAKGYGVDEMARVLDRQGITSWLIGLDGEMRARGLKPDGQPWAVAHERPDRQAREAMGVIELTDMAVATSGNYRHWREVEGRCLSHTMDPVRGAPLENGVASVTVLAPHCMTADAWATALMVTGPGPGLALARSAGLEAIFVLEDGSVQASL